ncbi:MAG: hypothetical protein J6B29_06155 [Clostridia bacterium]|nr:hypothetical protein [Clostridia bacterium]
MKKLFAFLLTVIVAMCLISCNSDDGENRDNGNTQSSAPTQDVTSDSVHTGIEVTGNSYTADIESINLAWGEDDNPTDIEITNFKQMIKQIYKDSKIIFTSEDSFQLTGTVSDSIHGILAQDCTRDGNEFFTEIPKKGNADIVVSEDKLCLWFDFYQGWIVSIDYKLEK